jgi:hypothetical protein
VRRNAAVEAWPLTDSSTTATDFEERGNLFRKNPFSVVRVRHCELFSLPFPQVADVPRIFSLRSGSVPRPMFK